MMKISVLLLVLTGCGSSNDRYEGIVSAKYRTGGDYAVVVGNRAYAVTQGVYESIRVGAVVDCPAAVNIVDVRENDCKVVHV